MELIASDHSLQCLCSYVPEPINLLIMLQTNKAEVYGKTPLSAFSLHATLVGGILNLSSMTNAMLDAKAFF